MNHEIPSTPEKDTDRQKVFIKRNNTGNVHPAYLTTEKDEEGRSIVEWFELDTESGKMVQRFKPVAEQGLGMEAQEALRREYDRRLSEEMGGTAIESLNTDVSDLEDDRFANIFDPDFKGDIQAAAVPETEDQRLVRERRQGDAHDAAMKRLGRPEMQ